MFRAQICAILGFGLMLAAASSEAGELNLSVDSNIGWDTNVFRRSQDETSQGFWEFSPRVGLRNQQKELEYDFSYRPTFQHFFTTDGIDGWDHRGIGNLTWRISPIDTLSAGGGVVSTRLIRQEIDDPTAAPDELILIQTDRERSVRSSARLGYSRILSQASSVRVDYQFSDIDFRQNRNVDNRSHVISLGYNFLFDTRTRVGLSTSFQYREARALDFGPRRNFSSETQTESLSFLVFRSLTPSLDLSISAGPSFIQTELNAPPGVDADSSTPAAIDRTRVDRSISYVADVSLTKRWEHSNVSLGYSRFQSGTGGSSSASIVDDVKLTVWHRQSRRLSFQLALGWNQREVISEQTLLGSQAAFRKSDRYSVSTSASYDLTDKIRLIARGSFRRFGFQSRSQIAGQRTSTIFTEVYVGTLILRYTFDPYIF